MTPFVATRRFESDTYPGPYGPKEQRVLVIGFVSEGRTQHARAVYVTGDRRVAHCDIGELHDVMANSQFPTDWLELLK